MASETIKAATDEAIEGLRQAYLKGYHRAALCWFANGGYSSGPDDDPSRFVSFASVLARFDADRQLIEQLVAALARVIQGLHDARRPGDYKALAVAEIGNAALEKARAAGAGKERG